MTAYERTLQRLLLATAAACISGTLAYHALALRERQTDFAQVWFAARAMWHGANPYAVVGPGKAFEWPFPLLYPVTALIVTLPVAPLPLHAACTSFVAVGAFTYAWAITRERLDSPAWLMFASAAYISCIRTAQWAPLLTAATAAPWLGFLLMCKPTIGAALFAAFPSRRSAISCALLLAASLLLLPAWPVDWLRSIPSAYHMSAPVTYVQAGGPLILLALTRWRRPEARLLVVMACLPQTTLPYETVVLFLIVRRWYESALLVIFGWLAMYQQPEHYLEMMHTMAYRMTLLLYLPCLVMILTRPNKGSDELAAFASRLSSRCVGAMSRNPFQSCLRVRAAASPSSVDAPASRPALVKFTERD